MGDLFLVDLADWLRAAGLNVRELEGWQYRARGSGGYDDGRPTCVMLHHTASAGGDGEADANYCTFVDTDAPLTNLVIGNTGIVWVCAGGATNTNGKGGPVAVSRGTVPADSMNTYAVGIELSNNGVGAAYGSPMIEAMFTASLTITKRLGLKPDDVGTHNWWAPDRKIDPATAAAVQGDWHPAACTGSGTWDVEHVRAECRRRSTQPDEEDEMTEADINKIVERVVDQLPAAVWRFNIKPDDETEPQPARWFLMRAYLIGRQYLGGWSGKDPPAPTVLQKINENTKK